MKKLFVKSKAHFIAKNEPVDIIKFYSDHPRWHVHRRVRSHNQERLGNKEHDSYVSHVSKVAGHIDDLTLGEGMVLKLPQL